MTTITGSSVVDLRYPTSKQLDGSSQAVREALYGSRIGFSSAESHELKGVDEAWPLYQPT